MKHSKLLWSFAGVGVVASAITLPAFAYLKQREANSTFSVDNSQVKRSDERSHEVPALTASSFVNRVSETEAPTLRGLVVNGNVPYIGEFKAEKEIKVSNIFSDPYMEEASGGAFYAEGKFYIMTVDQPYVGSIETLMTIYDAETWDIIDEREGLMPSSSGYCMTYDPATNAVYGYFMNDDSDETWQMFGRMNLATGEVLGLNNVDTKEGFRAIATGTDGYLYGVNATGMYCRITKKGEVTKLGHTDVKPQYVQSAAIDPVTGKFYWAGFTDEGQGGLYVVDPETYMASLIATFPDNQEIVGLYVVDNRTSADMPAEVLDLTASFVRDTTEGTVSFTAPDVYGDGKAINGSLTAHVAVDGNHYEKSVHPGEPVTFEVSTKYGGLYNVAAWVSTSTTAGNKKYVQKWVGPDNPLGVSNLEAKVDGTKVTVTWDAPLEGQHGGYVNPDDVTYIITRDGFGNKFVRDYTSTTFEDELGEGVSADVRYSVRTEYQDMAGRTTYSDWVHVGPEIMEIPVSLSPNSDFTKFIVIDANDDDNTWEPNYGGFASYTSGSEPADDWMLTPQIKLEAGTLYQLEYSVSAKMGVLSPEIIEVMMGDGETTDSMTTIIDSQTVKTYGITKFNTYTASFSVPTTGTYRLGFHAISEKGQQMGLRGIEINKLASSSGPAAVTAMSVTAAPLGELKAFVTFTLPEKDSDGTELKGLSKVELYNGDSLVDTANDITPGAECTLTDSNANQGTNRYTVVAYSDDGTQGVSANVSGWVGLDIPSTPTDFNIYEITNGVHMSWNLPATGINGGYVDPAEVTYLIIHPTYQYQIATAKGVTEADLTFQDLTTQNSLTLGLLVRNEAGTNTEGVVSPTIKIGPAYQLPFHEHFGHNTDYSWTRIGNLEDDLTGWQPEEETIGIDGLQGVSTYYGEYPGDSQKLASGKIHIPETGDITLRLWIMGRGYSENGGTFSLLASESYGKDYAPIFTRTFTKDTDSSWQMIEMSMKQFAGKDIYLAFEGRPADEGGVLIGIDNLMIRTDLEHDGAMTNINVDTDEVEVLRKGASVKVWVSNQGTKPMIADSYSIDFYAGDRMFASIPGKEMMAASGYSDYTAEYMPNIDDADPAIITARLNYADDQDINNNISNGVSVYVVKPELPSATELAANCEESGIALSWKAADLAGKPVRTVTDDFESYRTFDINRAGKWTIIDEDKSAGIAVSYFFPGSTDAIGWAVMQPSSIPTGDSETLADRLPAYSGEKYMVAYRPSSGDNRDWLITPLLSGNAQEISFMARAESFDQGREMFEVYYSTTGTELTDFKRLDDTSYRTQPEGWSEFKFKVPEGTKYFVVRCVSHNRLAMHIDDFIYESAATPVDAEFVGYNIYRNGRRLNDTPTTATTYLDTMVTEEENQYVVRAAYDRGEAPASNMVTVRTSGIETVIFDIDPATIPVYDLNGLRVYTLTEGNIYVTRGERFVYRKR